MDHDQIQERNLETKKFDLQRKPKGQKYINNYKKLVTLSYISIIVNREKRYKSPLIINVLLKVLLNFNFHFYSNYFQTLKSTI